MFSHDGGFLGGHVLREGWPGREQPAEEDAGGFAAGLREDVAFEPPKHAHPSVSMQPAGVGLSREALMPDNEPRALGGRFQPVGERRDLPLQPIGLPRLHQLMWRVDLQKLAFHRERLAIAAAPFGAPAAANPYIGGPSGPSIGFVRTPPADNLVRVVSARKTRSGGAAISTVARIVPDPASAIARAEFFALMGLPPNDA